jgi:hypothetical protein
MTTFLPINTLPQDYSNSQSRIIIVGHGDYESKCIHTAETNGQAWSPELLAEKISVWLGGRKVKHISLDMCCGAGNRGSAETPKDPGDLVQFSQFLKSFEVHPTKSFAYKFAAVAGNLAEEVSARTYETNTRVDYDMDPETEKLTVPTRVERRVAGRHHGFGDKFVFKTTGGTLAKPQDPKFVEPYVWAKKNG